MKKPLASALAALCLFTSVPRSAWSEDPASPALDQLTDTLSKGGWTLDTKKQVWTKGSETLYVNGGGVSRTPPKDQGQDPDANRIFGGGGDKKTKLDKPDNVPYSSTKVKNDGAGEKETVWGSLAKNQAVWTLGGGAIGGILGAAAFGPAGMLVFGLVGLFAGMIAHNMFGPKEKK
jgi:hypothetical protein